MAAVVLVTSPTIRNSPLSSTRSGLIRLSKVKPCDSTPAISPTNLFSPKVLIPTSRLCFAFDSFPLELCVGNALVSDSASSANSSSPQFSVPKIRRSDLSASLASLFVKDATVSVTYRSFSQSDGQRRLRGPSPRRRGSLAPYSSRASLQPSSETNDESAEDGSSHINNSKERVSGLADEQSRSKSQPAANGLNKAVRKTAATFAPRASTASKNPAPPGSTLYIVFEAQAYIAMALGGALSFNLLFPSDYPDIWRLMGMWSIWMFTVPSLRARDCSKKEKEALNYLFLVIPLVNVTLPIIWRSFAAVWSADVLAFFAIYAWKGWSRMSAEFAPIAFEIFVVGQMDWFSQTENVDDV